MSVFNTQKEVMSIVMKKKIDDYLVSLRVGLGLRLKSERVRLGYSLNSFSESLGIHRNTQRNYENGSRDPDDAYYKAASDLGVDLPYVINDVNNRQVPSKLGRLAEYVFSRYETGFNAKPIGDLFYLLGLNDITLDSEINSNYLLDDTTTDILIKSAFERGDVFHEAFNAIFSYAGSSINTIGVDRPNVRLATTMIFETISLYDELKDRLSGLDLHNAVRLAAEGVVKNHDGLQASI